MSKTWFPLISSPNIIKSYLRCSITVKKEDETLIAHLFDDEEDEEDEQLYNYGPFGLIKLGYEEILADLKFEHISIIYCVNFPYFKVFKSDFQAGSSQSKMFVQ